MSPKDVLIVEEESKEASARMTAGEGDGAEEIPQIGANK